MFIVAYSNQDGGSFHILASGPTSTSLASPRRSSAHGAVRCPTLWTWPGVPPNLGEGWQTKGHQEMVV